MSVFGVEQALYDVSVKRDVRTQFREDADTLLASYPLTQEERLLIKGFEVGELYRRGVNPLLTMGFWTAAAGERSLIAYLQCMRK